MNKRIKAKWVKALRSGKYKQARGVLRNAFGAMCCMGVLTDIRTLETGIRYRGDGDCPDDSYPTRATCKWAGIPYCPPGDEHEVPDTNEMATLIRMNDAGSRFKKIANWIEKHL